MRQHRRDNTISDELREFLDDSYDWMVLDEMRDAVVEADQDESVGRWDAVCKLAEYKDAQERLLSGKRVVIR